MPPARHSGRRRRRRETETRGQVPIRGVRDAIPRRAATLPARYAGGRRAGRSALAYVGLRLRLRRSDRPRRTPCACGERSLCDRRGGDDVKDTTRVIFRVWRDEDGGVLALFPGIPADYEGLRCESYEHVGQHSGADYTGCIRRTRPAKPSEYRALAKELRGIGYHLSVGKRIRPQDRDDYARALEAQA